MAVPDLLRALLVAPGPSGHEEEPARVWREAASVVRRGDVGHARHVVRARRARATVRRRSRSSATSTRSGSRSRTSSRTACSRSRRSAGSGPETLHGQRFELLTRERPHSRRRRAQAPLPGADARPRAARAHRPPPRHRRVEPRRGRAARARRRRRRVGRPAASSCRTAGSRRRRSTTGSARTSPSRRRGGSARAARRSTRSASRPCRRSSGPYGARAAAFGLAPDVAIVVDVTPATDVPGGDPQRAGAIELGMGAMIARGPTLNKKLFDLLSETAEAEGIAARLRGLLARDAHRRRRVPPRPRRGSRPACSRSRRATCTRRPRCATSPTSRRSSR